MPDFVVSTAFRTKEDMTKTFDKMGLGSNKFAKRAIRNFDRVERKGLSVKRIIGGILGAAAIQRGLGLMRQGVSGVVTEFLDFDDAITAASAKFGIFNRESAAFKSLGDTAREVGATTEFTSAQAAEGLRFLAKAGWEANAAVAALPTFVNLATASEMDFARAADIATDVMGAFRLKSDDVQENLKQLTRVNDVLSKAVNMSNIDMEDLFETIKFAGPIAKTAGVSLEDFTAAAAFVGGAGIKGSLGGTALRTMFLNLIGPTKAGREELAKLNTEIKDTKGLKDNRKALAALGIELDSKGGLNFIETMKSMSAGMKDLTPSAKAAALQIIFGKRAVSASAVSLDGATEGLQKYAEATKDAKGNSERLSVFMRTSLNKRLAELKSSAIEVGFKFIDAFKEKFPGGIDAALAAIRKLNIKGFIDDVRWLIGAAKDLLQVLRDYKGVFVGIGAAIVAAKIGGLVLSIIQLGKFLIPLVQAGGLKAVFVGLAGAAGPLIPIVAAIGGLAAGLFTVITRWDELKQASKLAFMDIQKWGKEVWNDITTWFSGIAGSVGNALSSMLDSLKGSWDRFKGLFGFGGATAPRIAAPSVAGPATDKRVVPEQSPAQRVQFDGKLDISGAPAGSKVSGQTRGAPPIQTNLLGANI